MFYGNQNQDKSMMIQKYTPQVGSQDLGSRYFGNNASGNGIRTGTEKTLGSRAVGGFAGAASGAAAGAAVGSVVPVVGTTIGALIGALLGGAGGAM